MQNFEKTWNNTQSTKKKPTENSFYNTKKHLIVLVIKYAMLEKVDFK